MRHAGRIIVCGVILILLFGGGFAVYEMGVSMHIAKLHQAANAPETK